MLAATQLPLLAGLGHWFQVAQTDPRAVALYARHYSSRNGAVDWLRYGIAGPGEVMTLLTLDGRALFVWQRQYDRMDGQTGINCAVFRNEGPVLSSTLILEAERLAWQRWPGERLFTFVDAGRVASANPGYCFRCAGWTRCGVSGRGLLIFEKVQEVKQ